ncbi:TonB-dependent receptor plug domain-containing protein, partial [Dyella sp.]|uniref:TonB-dependent receptor plug domain-containing protein n=1 Tax=Dyella sp. TaxID=1869338 RepID=UPI0039C8A70F
MLKKTPLATAMLALSLSSSFAYAQTASSDPSNDQNTTLKTIVVTATRTATTENDTLSSVTVITREDIERLQPTSLVDLLTGLPGVSMAQTGGIGGQASIFLRGTNADHTLLLVDGVRIGSVSAGVPALEQIPVEAIDRIEIVRGPRASLYGSDA